MSKARSQPARGTRDFLPDTVRQRAHVFGVIRDVYESYGFEPLDTPALERLDTLMGKYGDEGDQLLFKILQLSFCQFRPIIGSFALFLLNA